MGNVRDLVASLAQGGKDSKFIKQTTDDCYKENTLSRSQIYRIMKSLKDGTYTQSQRGRYAMRWTRTGILIADIAEAVREDGQPTV